MQEREFIPKIGMKKNAFWEEVTAESHRHNACNILMYMKLMLEKAAANKVPVHKSDFEKFGAGLSFFKGVTEYHDGKRKMAGWFDRINQYDRANGVDVRHYIVSSGIREMVAGTAIAGKFDRIYASSFCYDHNGVASWPALAVNYTTKTQFLFRINKGDLKPSSTNSPVTIGSMAPTPYGHNRPGLSWARKYIADISYQSRP